MTAAILDEPADAGAAALWPGVAALFLAAALAGAAPPTGAQVKTFCSEPVTPFCVNRAATFEDKMTTERCARDLEDYVAEMSRFIECLGEQQREAKGRAATLQTRFACMARGEADCR